MSIAASADAQITTTYVYDVHGRLLSATDSSGPEADYQYDDSGNRVQNFGSNKCPKAIDDAFPVGFNTIGTNLNVTGNDSDAESDPLTVTAPGTSPNGTVLVKSDGITIKYIPNHNFAGVDTFTYTLSDGACSKTATVTITVS